MQGILATKRVEAESILAIKGAEAEGLQRLLNSSSDTELVKFYLGLKDGLFGDVAGWCLLHAPHHAGHISAQML